MASGATRRDGGPARRPARSPLPAPLTNGDVRLVNAWSVLEAIRAGGVVSRAQIGELTGLTAMSVHRRVAELRRRRLIVAAGSTPAGSIGRPSSLFRFNGSIGHVVGLDVGNETTRAVLVDLDRRQLAELEEPTTSIEAGLAGNLEAAVRTLQASAGVRPDALMGLAAGIAGVTQADGTIVRASQHHGWDGLHLGEMLRAALGVDVDLRQDDHLAALAELHRGALVGARTAILLNVGKGVGLGIVTAGEVHAGAHGAAGRATWIPLGVDDGAAGPALVGDAVTGDGIVAEYRRAGGDPAVATARDVFAADAGGDPAASAAIGAFTSRLAWVVATAVAIVDPEVVVIGGGVSRSFSRIAEPLGARLAQVIPAPPPVVSSSLGPGAVISGAVDAALAIADVSLRARIGA